MLTSSSARQFVASFWMPAVLTLLILSAVGIMSGGSALFICAVLVVLEVTFSFDNAVVNAKVLQHMSPFWQKLFLTVGIFIAVFVVRFLLPIFIVKLTAGLGFVEVANLAINDPARYGQELHAAGPMIEAFGGTFLIQIGLNYFFDNEKDSHWLPFEAKLAAAGRFDNLAIAAGLTMALTLYFTSDPAIATKVLVASLLGLLLHMGLEFFDSLFGDTDGLKNKVGAAAFSSFLYLEVLDASFSFDGVIGAFAITTDVLIIAAGLTAGAIWVRSMTVHLVRAGTLGKFAYMENGAYWAIMALGALMIAKLYHLEAPEWVTGSLGLVFIAASIFWSIRETKLNAKNEAALTAA